MSTWLPGGGMGLGEREYGYHVCFFFVLEERWIYFTWTFLQCWLLLGLLWEFFVCFFKKTAFFFYLDQLKFTLLKELNKYAIILQALLINLFYNCCWKVKTWADLHMDSYCAYIYMLSLHLKRTWIEKYKKAWRKSHFQTFLFILQLILLIQLEECF